MKSRPTVQGGLDFARLVDCDRLDAQLLMAHVLGRSRTWVLAHGDDEVPVDLAARFEDLAARRGNGEPFAYLVGEREFHGLTLTVDDAVLVPRPDTETLVDWALELLAGPLGAHPAPAVIDLGTGSGAIALALKAACPRAAVWAAERSAPALAVARANATRLGLDVRFVQGDWWAALAGIADAPRFDLVVSNPPYIAADDPHLAALRHEPRTALVAADDGLADIARIAVDAPPRMAPGGRLLFEHGWDQADAVRALLAGAGFDDTATRLDLAARPRCSGGRLPTASSG